ncbi:fructose-bisphosphate aldolase-lysine N-methyltransferase, chloroplastic isoform X1 [Olea europaea var. sylvestris]|uniref:Fructose-bisphosphate aldolase-lysine N-methyltransferase, chloroplastic isoform X1 n=1 Tax=Olea europaea subsp. europaea TaxID=158383 RepID=A0A8S0VEG7_OLEEU|nr:fructose-bisphosphate aldolase-lysine N-methyltransferase, chloroplastic isoform X1 [Olea europaea var. sylvestris]XP_022845904.1 fructose-bisphosphate aldolase-lysine N-methyltransferase, chloroplastic isoform X1 [Olea europaea var. sylvestris]CAA3030389.1 fructose-bisphosphate aldolase-lysine N-methyltransferase, chloroplastic isoform X1 [Olea europaea subsp. europaea]
MNIDKNMIGDTSQIDNDVQLVLELSKGDPFLGKKKKVLEVMGFDPEGSMNIRSSFTPDQLTSFLNMMLQRARIINLDEVELYFSEDAIDLGGFTSLRNELEALDLILKVIDKVLSSGKGATINVLQNLRDVTLDRIHELGKSNGEETRIFRDSNSDKEKCLLEWGVKNGVKTKLDIAHVEGAGRGAVAREDLEVGDIALEIPLSVIISEDILHESDMFPILEQIDGISAETMLLLWSMKEKYNQGSKYKLYFDTLPEEFNTGLSFGIDAVMALDGALLLEEIVQAKEHLRIQYDELFPALCDCHPDEFPRELYTWEQFLWACELWYSNSMKVMFSDGKLRTCLIPVAGFLNHSMCPHIMHYGRIDSTTNSLKFPLSRPCNAGEQCFLSYGNFSSSHLVTFYGFFTQGDNPHDVISLDIDVPQDEDCEGGGAACEWNTHMVRGTWFSKNHAIFNYGLPRPLLNHLRRARTPTWESNTLTRENLEIELEVLGDLCSTFEGMMEALGEATLDDRETPMWDVKLALEFKALQRRIVSSILTSCYTGSKLLELELHKRSVAQL